MNSTVSQDNTPRPQRVGEKMSDYIRDLIDTKLLTCTSLTEPDYNSKCYTLEEVFLKNPELHAICKAEKIEHERIVGIEDQHKTNAFHADMLAAYYEAEGD